MFVVVGIEPEPTEQLCSAPATFVREVPMNNIPLQRADVTLKINQDFNDGVVAVAECLADGTIFNDDVAAVVECLAGAIIADKNFTMLTINQKGYPSPHMASIGMLPYYLTLE